MKKTVLVILFSLGIIAPVFAYAQTYVGSDQPNTFTVGNGSQSSFQLVPCNAPAGETKDPVTGQAVTPCDYNALLTLVQRVINVLLYASVFIAIILIVYAGWLYLTAGGDTGKTKTAHKIFIAIVVGMAISMSSWLIVNIAVTYFLNSSYTNAIPLKQQ